MIRVLLIGDLENWILGKIAKRLSGILSKDMSVTVLISHSEDFYTQFQSLQSTHDVVHFLSPWDFFKLSHKVYRPCVVMLWHMVDWTEFKKHRFRIDTLCVGSQQWLEFSQKYLPQSLPVKRIYYGLDTGVFERQPSAQKHFFQKHCIDKKTLVFGFAGSAWSNEGNRKGLDQLWKCLFRLKTESDISFVLRIIGRHWSLDMVPEELRLFTKIDLDLPDDDLPTFYSSLDYYVCTSRCEGVPYPVLESMSCECIVLSTLVGVVPEIIEQGKNGFLLQEISLEEDFIAAVRQTAAQPNVRRNYGFLARATIVKQFAWESAVNPVEYKDMYQKAIVFFQGRSLFTRSTLFLRSQALSRIEAPTKFIDALQKGLKHKFKSIFNIKSNV